MDGEPFVSGEQGIVVGPLPARLDTHVELGPAPADVVLGGVAQHMLLLEHDLTGPQPVWTCRSLLEATTPAGLQAVATVEVVYDPAFEQVVMHRVRVLRSGQWRDGLSVEAFQLLRRERNLERAQFDGSITAHLVLPDVRVGDIVETSYSIIGANPALKGRFAANMPLQWGLPAVSRTYRVRAPKGRQLSFLLSGAPLEFDERVLEDIVERTWALRPAPAFQYERDVPAWWIGHSQVAVADKLSWGEVAEVFRDYYTPPAQLPLELEAEVEQIEKGASEIGERVRRALRLVQSQIRYHAISIGEGGFMPRPVEQIWEARFGDCKDASRLLVAVLRRLGVEANPTLVNTFEGPALAERLPSIRAFNHCIVQVEVAGATYWLDPTRAVQGGTLERLFQARFGYVLPLIENADLVFSGNYEADLVFDAKEKWTFGRLPDDPVEAEISVILRSWRADELRSALANDGYEAVSKRYLEFHEHYYGRASPLTPTSFHDDDDANEITVTEKYAFERAWRPSEDREDVLCFAVADDVVGPTLVTPETPRRTAPIGLGIPRRMRTDRILDFPFVVSGADWNLEIAAPGVRYKHACDCLSSRQHRVVCDLTLEDAVIGSEDANKFFDFCRKARASSGYARREGVRNGKFLIDGQAPEAAESWKVVSWIAFGMLLLASVVAANM